MATATLLWTYPGSALVLPHGYNLYRTHGTAYDAATATLLGSVSPSVLTFTDSSPVYGMTYTYTVRAFNDAGEGPPANAVKTITVPTPVAPDSLAVTVNP